MLETHCPTLPSSNSAYDFVTGKPGAWMTVLRDMLARSALVGVGMAVAGERDHLLRNALAGGVAIEAFVLAWIYANCPRDPNAIVPPVAPAGALPASGWWPYYGNRYQPYLPVYCVRTSTWPYYAYCYQLPPNVVAPYSVTRLGQVVWHHDSNSGLK